MRAVYILAVQNAVAEPVGYLPVDLVPKLVHGGEVVDLELADLDRAGLGRERL